MPAQDRALALHQRAYLSLLVLYPPRFRRDWGPAMVQLFSDQLRHPRRPGRAVGVRVWLRTLDDLLSSVPRQQWEAFMEQTSTITRAVIVTSAVAIVAALGTGLAVVTAGIGPAIPLAILFALVVVIYRHQLRSFVTRRQGLWYRLLLAGIGLVGGVYLAGMAYWSTHDTTSTLFLIFGNTFFLLGVLLALAGTAMGIGQLWRRTHHREPHGGPGTRPTS
jgi:F0F1-type ATP synthase membrane subunit c/vacuolar-type H+-ATPase subunit K